MVKLPFTIQADLELGGRIAPYLVDRSADVEIRETTVPQSIPDAQSELTYQIKPGQILLRFPNGTRFLVEDGTRIHYERGPGCSDKDVALFLLGSAWGALCYQRGLIPLHASSVTHDGKVHAFTGRSGAGKSTLASGLARRGFELFSDDVLVIDPASQGSGVLCYVGQKELKLWRDIVAHQNETVVTRVRDDQDLEKYFVRPANSSNLTSAPLENLLILGRQTAPNTADNAVEPVSGAEKLRVLLANLYRPRFAETLLGRKPLFQALKRLSEGVRISYFKRRFLIDRIDESTNYLARYLTDRHD